MDTRNLEQRAETLITHHLLEAGILPTKPFFDHLGADLIGFTSVDDRGRFCRIQCKYRTLKARASVTINASYVDGAFVLFVYVRSADDKWLYCFMPEDIRQVFRCSSTAAGSVYRLEISKNTIPPLAEYDYFQYQEERNIALFHLMKITSPNAELQKMILDLRKNMQDVSQLRQKHDDLQKLIHEFELMDIQEKAGEEQLKILKEYAEVLEQQLQV